MKNVRINTDQRFNLSLKAGSSSIDMTSIDVLSLYMYCNPQKARDGAIKHSVSISDAKVLEMIWPADVQRYLGEHSVHGTIRYAGAVASFDVPSVNVVSKTSEADISTDTIVLEAPVGTEDLTATITIQGVGPQGPKGDKMTYADLNQEDKKDLYEGASEVMKPLLATKQNTLTDTDGSYGQRVAELEKGKQDTLTAGNGISIEGNVISSSVAEVVDNIVNAGYVFAGVATPSTNPGTPDAKVFYIANGKETYTNFGGIEVIEDEVVVLYYDTEWHKVATGIASQEKLTELGKEIATKQDIIPDLDSIRSGAALGASALQKETDPNVPSWAKASTKPSYTPAEIGAASEESLQIHENDNIRHITASERTKWNEKQDALTLTVKDNGNIVIANIQGQTKEFMPATPSGDPMHYAYVEAGAEWNGTGADIVKTTPWAELADDDADKTVVHKAGYWYLNGLGDITTKEMKAIFNETKDYVVRAGSFANSTQRTCLPLKGVSIFVDCSGLANGSRSQVLVSNGYYPSSGIIFRGTTNMKHICGKVQMDRLSSTTYSFNEFQNLKTISLFKIANSIKLGSAKILSSKSILYMIKNEAATSAITIILHADAYARAMANADIVAALEAHPNVSLASK